MKLQNINVAEAKQFPTNTKGRNEGTSFDELVASVKEKGVLVPVLARQIFPAGKASDYYEVIAGNRRLAAAKAAGIKEIPAHIVEMDDNAAREAQIVENLQRADVHPLDEGEAYRKLIEESKLGTGDIAIRVGKSETYVKQRLFLTNLEEKPATAYRNGKIIDGHAVLIAKLSAGDQIKALAYTIGGYSPRTVKELKEWIEDNIYSSLDNQPWLKDTAALEAVGSCKECEPNRASLFGDVKEGACTDLKCWARKMTAYLAWRAKEEKLTKVSNDYGEAPKGIVSRSDYVLVAKKGKDRCKSVHGAIVIAGSDTGKVIDICTDQHCPTHRGMKSQYGMTPAEQAKRKAEQKKENEKAKVQKEKFATDFQEAIKKVKYPLSSKQLDALMDFAFHRCGFSYQQPAANFLGLEPVMKKEKIGWGTKEGQTKMVRDYGATLRKFAEDNGDVGKLKVVFALLMPHPADGYEKKFTAATKKI